MLCRPAAHKHHPAPHKRPAGGALHRQLVVPQVERLLRREDAGFLAVEKEPQTAATPLHLAARYGRLQAAERLLLDVRGRASRCCGGARSVSHV